MDDNGKRDRPPEISTDGEAERKRARTQPPEDDVISAGHEDNEVAALLNVNEEAFVEELQELLGSSPVILPPSPPYVTINGNIETCGSSFSGADSSVMASFDFAGITVLYSGAWGTEARGGGVEGKGLDGWDCSDEFDGMLGWFLGEDICEK